MPEYLEKTKIIPSLGPSEPGRQTAGASTREAETATCSGCGSTTACARLQVYWVHRASTISPLAGLPQDDRVPATSEEEEHQRAGIEVTVPYRKKYCPHPSEESLGRPGAATFRLLAVLFSRCRAPWLRWLTSGCPRGGVSAASDIVGDCHWAVRL